MTDQQFKQVQTKLERIGMIILLLAIIVLIAESAKSQVLKRPNFPRPSQVVVKPQPVHDTVQVFIQDTSKGSGLSITDFGAHAGSFDNAQAFDNAIAFVIQHPQVLNIPIGSFYTSRSLLMQNIVNGVNKYFTVHIKGVLSNKSASDEYLSKIVFGQKAGFGIGMQFGRGIVIENLTILGKYTFPYSVNNYNIGILHFSDWNDPTISDTRYNPYAGISIDPNLNQGGSRGGTSDVTIRNCSIHQWMVGIALSPNGFTQNDEMINIEEDNIDAVRVAIAVCQDQSKTVSIKGLKVWSSCYTVLDGSSYGAMTGGGSVFCENWNIAGNCKELFNLNTGRFPLSAKDIYSESLFRIGNVGGGAGANMINTEIDFLTGDGMPEADYLVQGQINFYGGMLRYYDSDLGHRMNLATTGFVRYGFMFRDMCFNNYPITQGLYGIPTNYWFPARFDNITSFYIRFNGDTLIQVPIYSAPNYTVNRSSWTAVLIVPGIGSKAQLNDYILAEPTSTTCNYWDGVGLCATKICGRVYAISGDTLFLKNVPVNMTTETPISRMYISRLK